jgi:dTDP-4-amino-4,6-dideoxygalactose transaminase
MNFMKNNGVQTTFHYLPLHSSKYYEDKHDGRKLPNCDRYADTLVRLPLFYELTDAEAADIARLVIEAAHGLLG